MGGDLSVFELPSAHEPKAPVNRRTHSKGFATPDALDVAKRVECVWFSTAFPVEVHGERSWPCGYAEQP